MECKCFLKNVFFIAPLLGTSFFEAKVLNVNERNSEYSEDWPMYNNFGQISAVAVDKNNNIYVFHRGNRQWSYNTFESNVFIEKNKGPISNETIVVLDHLTGSLIRKTGENFFYLPHGLTVDDEYNIWITDVAMHQIFKFPPINLSGEKNSIWKPELTLGVLLEPGSDDNHFCKPTSVAVDAFTQEFYVADGYCNGRIVKYSKAGKKLLQWGKMYNGFHREMTGYMLSVPHSLALSLEKKIIYVADREHFRVVSYDIEFGKFTGSFAEEKEEKVFSVAYSNAAGGLVYALTNTENSPKTVSVYDSKTRKFLLDLSLKFNLTNPHDLAISPDGKYCYVVELSPYKIWKVKIDLHKILNMLNTSLHQDSNDSVKELISADSKISKSEAYDVSSSFLAVALVISVVVISFLFFMFHFYKKKGGFRKSETRRLILDDFENDESYKKKKAHEIALERYAKWKEIEELCK